MFLCDSSCLPEYEAVTELLPLECAVYFILWTFCFFVTPVPGLNAECNRRDYLAIYFTLFMTLQYRSRIKRTFNL
jgi:hypothetical protein